MNAAYTIVQTPSGKWRLTKGPADMGLYDSRDDAEEAMFRIINRQEFNFDENGKLI